MSSDSCKTEDTSSPDYAATRGTVVETLDGQQLKANINTGTGQITYEPVEAKTSCCSSDPEKMKTCDCKQKNK